jgi:hypothetical protein
MSALPPRADIGRRIRAVATARATGVGRVAPQSPAAQPGRTMDRPTARRSREILRDCCGTEAEFNPHNLKEICTR